MPPIFRSTAHVECCLPLTSVMMTSNLKALAFTFHWRLEVILNGEKSKKRNGTLQIPLLCAHINAQKRKNVVPAFQLVLDYLDTHFAEWDISAKQVSEAVGIGINRVNSIVREQTGNSCKSYITKLRLKKACQMLVETDKPVFEIAEQVGYSSASYFIRVFKESLGETPESYRKSPHPFVS